MSSLTIAGLWTYGDWRHVATGYAVLVFDKIYNILQAEYRRIQLSLFSSWSLCSCPRAYTAINLCLSLPPLVHPKPYRGRPTSRTQHNNNNLFTDFSGDQRGSTKRGSGTEPTQNINTFACPTAAKRCVQFCTYFLISSALAGWPPRSQTKGRHPVRPWIRLWTPWPLNTPTFVFVRPVFTPGPGPAVYQDRRQTYRGMYNSPAYTMRCFCAPKPPFLTPGPPTYRYEDYPPYLESRAPIYTMAARTRYPQVITVSRPRIALAMSKTYI